MKFCIYEGANEEKLIWENMLFLCMSSGMLNHPGKELDSVHLDVGKM